MNENMEKQKVKEITDKLEQGIKELFESEKYKTYLTTMSKFHHYSFNNTLLIAMQKPEASLVAGYKAWQHDFHRHVNKGEKAIRILAPAPYKIKEERDKLDPVTGELVLDENGMPQTEEVEVKIPAFRAVSVFDVSQTEGEPIPELETAEPLSTVEGYEDFMRALKNIAPVPIDFEEIVGNTKGYYSLDDKRIAIQSGMSESQTVKTAVHETAHALLHDKDVNQEEAPAKDRNTREVEAESIAYTVCQHFGIETSDYSFSYIAGWSSGRDMKELKASLDTIRKTASELIISIEGQLREIAQERAAEQMQEKESLLLIQNQDLSEYTLVSVHGMSAPELAAALAEMTEEDKGNPVAYLESRGVWTAEIANEQTREFGEYHIGVHYNFETDEITDVRTAMEQEAEADTSGHNVQKSESGKPIEDAGSRETQLLYGDTDSYGIYQLKDIPELRDYQFAGTAERLRRNLLSDTYKEIHPDNYNLVYKGDLSELHGKSQSEKLNEVSEKFNLNHPEGFIGHSLSVSDVVVIHENGKNTAHFVDSFGFTLLPEFMQTLEDERNQTLETSSIELTEEGNSFLELEWQAATSGHNVQKSEQTEPETDDGDEIIDLGDDRDSILAEMKQSLVTEQIAPPSTVIGDFRAKTDELFHEISEMSASEVEETVKCHVQAKLDELGIEAQIVDAVLVGTRCRGLEREGSDIDVVVELTTNEREDVLFDTFNEGGLTIGGIKVDINPITAQRTGTLETYLLKAEEYLAGVQAARGRDTFGHNVQKSEPEVTMTVAECGEFHNLGTFYEDIKTVDEAIAIWEQIRPNAMNMGPAIGINVHVPGTKDYEDGKLDILSVGRFDLEFLDRVPEACDNPKAMDMIAELIAKMPQYEVLGEMSKELTAKVQEIRDAAHIDYKPLAKVEEMEEQNYNQIDNVLNNGYGEKSRREERVSLKVRLTEKKAEIADKGKAQSRENSQKVERGV